ncbi:serine protease [Actinoplanes sp. GCM10030250]|uniref:S1 family peptidase n=1 Tax=Actinoplanes sp. GCM10030250 TaxID=3273376 RepID=UPI00361FB2F9
MIDGRVMAGDHDLGSGFCLTDRIVATAAHVLEKREAPELSFVTSSGTLVEVDRVEVDEEIDTALLWVRRSLAFEAPLGIACQQAEWRVTSRPDPNAAQLTGTVSAVEHLMTNADGHEMTVLQLKVEEGLKDFGGYSGSAVIANSLVVGILVEQLHERAAPRDQRPRATNVLYAVPITKVVGRFKLRIKVGQRQESTAQHLMHTAHFDMDPLKTAILATLFGGDDRSFAFGLAGVDMKVVMNLCAWLPTYIGEVAQKSQLGLRPEIAALPTLERYVTRYLAELEGTNVVCPILVDNADTALVDELWKRVRTACGKPRKRLILFFVGRPADGFPDHVTELESPAVQRRDVAEWARHVVAVRRWPRSLAEPWTTAIVEQVRVVPEDGNTLDLRLTYEVLEHYIERVRLDPDGLLSHLEELEIQC